VRLHQGERRGLPIVVRPKKMALPAVLGERRCRASKMAARKPFRQLCGGFPTSKRRR